MSVDCPFCRKPLKTELIADFLFCEKCAIAVRNETDMPLSGENIYDERWAKLQGDEKYNFRRAMFTQKQIRQLHGIKTVLDIGCGTGILVNVLSRRGYIVDGIDISLEAIEFAKSHRKGNFYLSSIEGFRSKYKYDLVIATQLIEHLRNPESLLINVKRLLNLGGYVYVETPNLYSWNKRSIWRRRIGGMFYGTDHRICYTTRSLSVLLRDNGLKICKILTKTYSPTIFVEIITTFISAFTKKSENVKELVASDVTNNKGKNLFKNICRYIYKQLRDSLIVDILLFIPNKMSEFGDCGNQLIVIAKNGASKNI